MLIQITSMWLSFKNDSQPRSQYWLGTGMLSTLLYHTRYLINLGTLRSKERHRRVKGTDQETV